MNSSRIYEDLGVAQGEGRGQRERGAPSGNTKNVTMLSLGLGPAYSREASQLLHLPTDKLH